MRSTRSFTNSQFNPLMLSSLQIWLDASNPYQNGTFPTDGGLVTHIQNIGHGSFTCSQSNSAFQPEWHSNQYNGKGIIRTDGSEEYFNLSGFTFGSQFTMFIVCTPSAQTNAYMNGTSNASGSGPAFISDFTVSGTTYNYEYYNNTDRIHLSTSATGLNVCCVTQVDSSSLVGYFNGTQISSITPTVAGSGFVLDYLLSSAPGVNNYQGDFGAYLICNTALSPSLVKAVTRYLGREWGISVA